MPGSSTIVHYQKTEAIDAQLASRVRNMAGQVLLNRTMKLCIKRYVRLPGILTGEGTPTAIYWPVDELRRAEGLSHCTCPIERTKIRLDSGRRDRPVLTSGRTQAIAQEAADALRRKHIQLIFTTHFPPVAEMYDEMCIYSLNRVPAKTVVWRGYSYEAMRHITGEQERPILCYVEDDVAEQIVARVATELRIR